MPTDLAQCACARVRHGGIPRARRVRTHVQRNSDKPNRERVGMYSKPRDEISVTPEYRSGSKIKKPNLSVCATLKFYSPRDVQASLRRYATPPRAYIGQRSRIRRSNSYQQGWFFLAAIVSRRTSGTTQTSVSAFSSSLAPSSRLASSETPISTLNGTLYHP